MGDVNSSIKVVSTGSYLPEQIITNKELEKRVDTTDKWIFEKLGIKERRIASSTEFTSDLGANASIDALENSGLEPQDIDLILVATSTPDRISPSTACIIQDKIEAYNSVAFDFNAVCSGFIYGMQMAAAYVNTNLYENILLIGAEKYSSITDWESRNCVYFGDGAGAAIISKASDGGFFASKMYSDGRGKHNFTVPGIGTEIELSNDLIEKKLHKFSMNGKAVYETGTEVLPASINEILLENNISIEEIDYLIPHQPSIKILEETSIKIGLPFEKVVIIMDRYANTAGASIPIGLDELNSAGKIKRGSQLLFAAVGSGWTWGSAILKWE
ncbi:MAG: beta-ketoacyl-ACP synthase III [Candidatus Kariarchaeaceae archaeon]|jgi:3-oxoacyl-[acyl-carrier-protein] synthase-3